MNWYVFTVICTKRPFNTDRTDILYTLIITLQLNERKAYSCLIKKSEHIHIQSYTVQPENSGQ